MGMKKYLQIQNKFRIVERSILCVLKIDQKPFAILVLDQLSAKIYMFFFILFYLYLNISA